MDRQKFDQVIAGTLCKVANTLMVKHKNMLWRDDWENQLFDTYNAQRQDIRKKMQLPADVTAHRIDRHKIASAMAQAILTVKPLNANGDTSPGARLANEYLAFLSGVLIVWHFVVEAAGKTQPNLALKYRNTTFEFPPASDCEYVVHAYKMLFHHPDGGGALVLANIFFLLEAYQLRTIDANSRKIDAPPDEVTQASI